MASTAESGSTTTLKVSLSGGTLVAVAGETDFVISFAAPAIDTDSKGDTATFNMPSRYKSNCKVSTLYIHSDAAQQRLITQMKANGQVTLEIMRGSSAYQSCTATITSLEVVHADKQAATFSAEFAVDGEWA
jgi:predicted secreted protein